MDSGRFVPVTKTESSSTTEHLFIFSLPVIGLVNTIISPTEGLRFINLFSLTITKFPSRNRGSIESPVILSTSNSKVAEITVPAIINNKNFLIINNLIVICHWIIVDMNIEAFT